MKMISPRIAARVVACLLFVIMAACSAATQGGVPAECEPIADDSALRVRGPVYTECDVDEPAEVLQSRMQPPTGTPPRDTRSRCMRAEAQFVVGVDGRPERDTIEAIGMGDLEFRQVLLASIPQWTYRPAMLDGVAVRQIERVKRTAAVVATSGGPPTNPPNCL